MNDRPNILFIETDEQHARCLGWAGHPFVNTPTLDRLARMGARFEAAYCNNPVCVPSRASTWTGKLPETTGYRHNWTPTNMLQDGHVTMAAHFAANGYNTCAVGKTHTRSYDQCQGWKHRFFTGADHGFTMTDMPLVGDRMTGPAFRPGFDSVNVWTHFERAGIGPRDTTCKDPMATRLAEHFLRNWFTGHWNDAPGARPLFMYVGYESPHYMFNAPAEFFRMYRDKVELPEHPADCIDDLHIEDRKYLDRYLPGWRERRYPESKVLDAIAAYYGMISFLDLEIARLVQLIEMFSDPSKWIIVFTSDHGEMLGERGLWFKTVPYEASIRVPLTIAWPGRIAAGRATRRPVSLIDLYPTLSELAGLEPTLQALALDGDSLAPWLSGREAEPPDRPVICQTYGRGPDYDEATWTENHTLTRITRRGDWKAIERTGYGDRELYDLAADPRERRNLAGDPEAEAHAPDVCTPITR